MSVVYLFFGLMCLALGAFAVLTIKSDIQLIIVLTLIVGGIILCGISSILAALRKIGG